MKHRSLESNVLLVVLGMGAMGPPLLGPLLESLKDASGLTRGHIALWYFLLGLVGSSTGLMLGVVMSRTPRTTFVRAGTFLFCIGCGLLAVATPAPGRALLPLAAAVFAICLARPLASAANGIFADLWDAAPHTGLIVLHMVNSFGKLAAPRVVLVLGSAIWRSGLTYAAFFGVLALHSLLWPSASVGCLKQIERRRDVRRRLRWSRDPVLWACMAQFGLIAGSEAGATLMLGSFVQHFRPSPFAAVGGEGWGRIAIAVMLTGIVAGRVVFAVLSRRLGARAIITSCLACGIFALPAALAPSPGVYVPAMFLTGVCFSATWPAFFGLAAREFPGERTFLSLGAGLANVVGMGAVSAMVGAIGTETARLPWAFLVGVAMMLPMPLFLFATPWGRKLGVAAG
jgi:MFS family permease